MRIYLSRPHMSGAERRYVDAAFESNFIAPLGPQLDAFEASVSDYLGGEHHCVGLASGSAALHLALRIAGVERGDRVWISSMTFAGGIFPVLYMNAHPIFFDLSPDSWTLDCNLIEERMEAASKDGALPKAVLPTDLYGQSVDIDRLEAICARHGVALILDSAESLGAQSLGGRPAGTGGDAAILSFNGNKIITTSGGGMLVTRSRRIADEARFLSTQARDPAPHYEHSTFGYNYRLSNVCAAIGLGQMEVLDQRVDRRRAIARTYMEALGRPGISFMPEPEGYRSTRWLTSLTIDPEVLGVTREDVRLKLLEYQIESRPLWKPMHMQPLFADGEYIGSGFDESLFEKGLSLPSGSDMTDNQQAEVIGHVLDLLGPA
ncbi:DegT/DnrJ/EryC1/StrS family aminotransferase [Meridianimarinicoccus sp. RP-17]|uniref:DegT/DnrJ/EryC1/StrS family aminotransferase n=1 Tax=Meridianimarinicoccus zhengii TaxID=2056810 RepID=UPI000DAE48AA|nr:aminotransferase class I/II-fold pyridoxal phosphate-dependent enzyme [Phycocomes zhengii]